MAVIVPTITTDSVDTFNQFTKDYSQFSKRIHVDFSDGTFAATTLVPLENMAFPEGVQVDLHLMTANPSQYTEKVLALKPNLCIVHSEVGEDLMPMAQALHGAGIKFGIALLKGTYPKRSQQAMSEADHMMIFAGNLGSQGGQADLLQMEKVPIIKTMRQEIEIAWDGGVNLSNVRAIAHAGIDVVNVGGAIANAPDHAAMYKALNEEAEQKGVMI